MRTILRVFKFAFQSFWRNIWLSFATVTVLVLALLAFNFIIIFNYIARVSIEAIADKIDVVVLFQKEAASSDMEGFVTYVQTVPQVKEVQFISSQKALELFKERHRQEPEILQSLDELTGNPLSASLVIKAVSVDDYDAILEIVSDSKYADFISSSNFEDYRDIILKIQTILNRVQEVGLIISGIFLLISIFIIVNTVRMGIYTHREEISIMKLVGASNFFVRVPFLLESVFYAFLAVFVTVVLIYPVLNFIQPYFFTFFGDQFDVLGYFHNNALMIFGGELGAIIVLNVISSGLAVGRYLKV